MLRISNTKQWHVKYAQDISQVYNAFSTEAEAFFRKAMLLAARTRVLRVQHILAASGNTEAAQQIEEFPTGYLDSPLTNSPTIRRALSLTLSLSQQWGMEKITPELLVKVVETVGGGEQPPIGQNEPLHSAEERIKAELGIEEQAVPNTEDDQVQPVDENRRSQVINTALQQLQQGIPSSKVGIQFMSDMIKVDPNFTNSPYPMMIMSVQNNPQQLEEFIQGFADPFG